MRPKQDHALWGEFLCQSADKFPDLCFSDHNRKNTPNYLRNQPETPRLHKIRKLELLYKIDKLIADC